MRVIIRWALIIIAIIVGYNYFFGDSHEKSESEEIVEQVRELGKSIFGFVKNEKERMEEGKYEGLFEKIESVFDVLKSQQEMSDPDEADELRQLEKDKAELENEIKDAVREGVSQEREHELEAKIRELLQKSEILLDRQLEK